MAIKEIAIGRCPICRDDSVSIQVDTSSGQVIINNVEQSGEWKKSEGNEKLFVGVCGSDILGNEKENICNQLIAIKWFEVDNSMIAFYPHMRRHSYTSHYLSGGLASSENLGGMNYIYLETEIDGGRVLTEEVWEDTVTGRAKIDIVIPAEVLGKIKLVPDMGEYMTTAIEPLNGAIAIAAAKRLLEPIATDIVGICDIKCESNPDGRNDCSTDYSVYKRLERVMQELSELTAVFVSINNDEEP